MGPRVGSVPSNPVRVDTSKPGGHVPPQLSSPGESPEDAACDLVSEPFAVAPMHQVREEEVARTAVVRGSEWVQGSSKASHVHLKRHYL